LAPGELGLKWRKYKMQKFLERKDFEVCEFEFEVKIMSQWGHQLLKLIPQLAY
jgi:hypothetical protein